jgi:hypothetical protein
MLRSSTSPCGPHECRRGGGVVRRFPHPLTLGDAADAAGRPQTVIASDLLLAAEVWTDELFSGTVVRQQGLIATNEVPELSAASLPRGVPPTASFFAPPRLDNGDPNGERELAVDVRGALNGGLIAIHGADGGFENGTKVSLKLPQTVQGESPLHRRVVDILATATATGAGGWLRDGGHGNGCGGGGYVTAATVPLLLSPLPLLPRSSTYYPTFTFKKKNIYI